MPQKLQSISIVIPAYNEEHHLKACLDAIKKQTVKPAEVIVVDNNSTDNTASTVMRYPFVTLLHEKKQGVVFARDRGFNAAKGKIIGRIDADTVLPADWVARVAEFYSDAENTERSLTGGGYPINLRLPHFWGWVQGQIAFRINRVLLGHYILFGSNMAIPKRVWQNVKGSVCDDTDVHEDLDLAIHTHRAGYKIVYQESLRVGGVARRLLTDREQLWDNAMLWPRTLRRHGIWTWVFGWLGAFLLWALSPVLLVVEYTARFTGRRSR